MNKDVLHDGKIAYANVTTTNSLIRQMIEAYEYPAYAFGILFPNADKQVKDANKNTYWQRVPNLDIVEEEAIAVR